MKRSSLYLIASLLASLTLTACAKTTVNEGAGYSLLTPSAETASFIEQRRFDLDARRACGFQSINGALRAVGERGLEVRTLDLRSSGDTAGPKDRVVGYGAFAAGTV